MNTKGQENFQVESVQKTPGSIQTEVDDDDAAFPTLYVAVVFGLEDVVKTTVQNDTDVNFNDKNSWIPLHTACAFGESTISSSMLEQTIISISHVLSGQEQIAEILIQNGANVNLKDNLGYTPLFVSSASGINHQCYI